MKTSLSRFALLLPCLLIAWGVAVWGSNADALWLDEWWTTYFISAVPYETLETPAEVIERVVQGSGHENNPVGYYVLLYFWHRLVGGSDVALRLFSAFCILLSVSVMFQLGRAVYGVRVGIIAALLLGFSAFYLNYSHEMRAYALAGMWTVLILLAYWRFMSDTRTGWGWGAVLMGSAAALIYTHYSNATILGALGLIHLFVRPRNRRWWQAIGLAFGALVLFLPHLIITSSVLSRLSSAVNADRQIDLGLGSLPSVLWQALTAFANEQPGLVIVLLIACGMTLTTKLTPRPQKGLIFSGGLILVGIIPPVILLQAYHALFHMRYLLTVWSPLALFAALVLTLAVERLRGTAQQIIIGMFVAVWAGLGLMLSLDMNFHGNTYIPPEFRNALTEPTRWDTVGETLAKITHPQDALVVSVGVEAAWAHFGTATYYTYGLPARSLVLESNGVDESVFSDFIHGASRVWLVRTDWQSPTDEYQTMEATLTSAGYKACGAAQHVGGTQIMAYSAAPACCEAPQTVLAQFGDAATLRYSQVVSQGTSIAVWQGWQVTTDTPDNYQIGTYAFDTDGNVIGQRDMSLPASGYSCILSEFSSSTPENTLHLTVYDWQSGVRLPVAEGDANQLIRISAP